MQLRTLCLTLLATAIVAGCRSTPSQDPAEMASVATATEASPVAASMQADDVRAEARMQHMRQRSIHGSAPLMAPPPAAPAKSFAPPREVAFHAMPPPHILLAKRENYAERTDNPVHRTSEQPVSTFSVDVDTGSYSNVRRMLQAGQRPPADAVRAEDFINYFDYLHPAPLQRDVPFRVTTELSPTPWNASRQLLMIGIKGYDVPKAVLPPSNLVFLIDTSGSMDSPDKLPLLQQAFRMLVPQMRAQDSVSIVVYAGSAGLVLPPTPGDRHGEILAALGRLQAGGSTNGGDGIALAYAMARQAFIDKGVNRVILATDGDFNVGTVSQDALETPVGDQRASGVALTTLGFGQGNYNDAMAERLADVGDGNHAYIDTAQEARKVLVDEMQATLMTIARDVKIQVEFNPALVSEYRLIGYENRLLQLEDFANDRVDAGDIGAGHEVTALYEITPVGSSGGRLSPLRYRQQGSAPPANALTGELAHLRLRYKQPGGSVSKLIETPIFASSLQTRPSQSLRFASAVAAYADLLRGGSNIGRWSWEEVIDAAREARGEDRFGLRGEFVRLVEQGRSLVEPGAATAGRIND